MWDFAWHLRGSVALDEVGSIEVALNRLEGVLGRHNKSVIERGSDYLAFDNPFWRDPFEPGWRMMAIYDRGRFWIERGLDGRKLCYDLRSLHGMVFCLFAALLALLFGSVKIMAAAFALIYGSSILLAGVRIPHALHRAVNDS